MKKLSFFSTASRGVKTQLRGLRLLAIGLMGLMMLSPPLRAQPGSVYRIRMSNPGAMGVTTTCSVEGYVLATWGSNRLTGDTSALDADGSPGPDLFLNLLTDVAWTRKYDAGRGTAGTFNGCFGETFADPATGNLGFYGGLFLFFENKKGVSTIRFIRHFDYYVTSGNTIREHFTLSSDNIPYPAWTGGNLSERVKGTFDLAYYLKEGRNLISPYVSLTGGVGRYFEFDLSIEKVQ